MRGPIVFSSRPDQELFNAVARRFKEWSAIPLSAGEKERVNRQVESDFVQSALKLSASQGESGAGAEARIQGIIEAFHLVRSFAESEGKQAALTLDLILRLGSAAGSGLRNGPAAGAVPAEHLQLILEGACRWFSADSFDELNPAEQAAIVALRLIELQPFEESNLALALTCSSLFTMRSGLPPLIIPPEQAGRFRAAIEEGLKANTKPLVELIAASLEMSLARMIEETGKGRV
jgi:hypothetical protein